MSSSCRRHGVPSNSSSGGRLFCPDLLLRLPFCALNLGVASLDIEDFLEAADGPPRQGAASIWQ